MPKPVFRSSEGETVRPRSKRTETRDNSASVEDGSVPAAPPDSRTREADALAALYDPPENRETERVSEPVSLASSVSEQPFISEEFSQAEIAADRLDEPSEVPSASKARSAFFVFIGVAVLFVFGAALAAFLYWFLGSRWAD
jgi:hypothetical protein